MSNAPPRPWNLRVQTAPVMRFKGCYARRPAGVRHRVVSFQRIELGVQWTSEVMTGLVFVLGALSRIAVSYRSSSALTHQ